MKTVLKIFFALMLPMAVMAQTAAVRVDKTGKVVDPAILRIGNGQYLYIDAGAYLIVDPAASVSGISGGTGGTGNVTAASIFGSSGRLIVSADGGRGIAATDTLPAIAITDLTYTNLLRSSSPINAQSGTTYTTVAGDANKTIIISNAASNTVTIAPNSAAAIQVGDYVQVVQGGAGATTVAAGSGVTINTPGSLTIGVTNGSITLLKTATNTWQAFGPVSAIAGAIPDGSTATTQAVHDNSTKLATNAYADRAALVGNAPVNLGNLTGTININWSLGQMFYGTLTGNTTFTFSGATSGQTIVVDVAQTGTNSYTVTWPSAKWAGGTAPTMTAGAATSDVTTILNLAGTYKASSVQDIK